MNTEDPDETDTCTPRSVQLQNEHRDDGSWLNMDAYLAADGTLTISGQDLGTVARSMSGDDEEYEWFYTVAAKDVPALVVALGGQLGDDVIDLLERRWSGDAAYQLGATLRRSGVHYEFGSFT